MRQTGIAYLPLHGGKAPAWLFQRMVRLGREIVRLRKSLERAKVERTEKEKALKRLLQFSPENAYLESCNP